MFKTFKTLVEIFWILDICDAPFMEMFDTTYPLNGLFWVLTLGVIAFESSVQDGLNIKFDKDEK